MPNICNPKKHAAGVGIIQSHTVPTVQKFGVGHPDNFVFSMKTHTFICQINCKINRKYEG